MARLNPSRGIGHDLVRLILIILKEIRVYQGRSSSLRFSKSALAINREDREVNTREDGFTAGPAQAHRTEIIAKTETNPPDVLFMFDFFSY